MIFSKKSYCCLIFYKKSHCPPWQHLQPTPSPLLPCTFNSPVPYCWKLAFCCPTSSFEWPANGILTYATFCAYPLSHSKRCSWSSHAVGEWSPLAWMSKGEDGPESLPAYLLRGICILPSGEDYAWSYYKWISWSKYFSNMNLCYPCMKTHQCYFWTCDWYMVDNARNCQETSFSLHHSCKLVRLHAHTSIFDKIM